MTEQEKEIRDGLRATLRECINHIPKSLGSRSWNAAVEFKKWAADANKLVNKANASIGELSGCIGRYETFN